MWFRIEYFDRTWLSILIFLMLDKMHFIASVASMIFRSTIKLLQIFFALFYTTPKLISQKIIQWRGYQFEKVLNIRFIHKHKFLNSLKNRNISNSFCVNAIKSLHSQKHKVKFNIPVTCSHVDKKYSILNHHMRFLFV